MWLKCRSPVSSLEAVALPSTHEFPFVRRPIVTPQKTLKHNFKKHTTASSVGRHIHHLDHHASAERQSLVQ